MLKWDIINQKGICIRCSNESETINFLLECEKVNIDWKSGLKPMEGSKCYRNISTNGGQYLTEGSDITSENTTVNLSEVKEDIEIKITGEELLLLEEKGISEIRIKIETARTNVQHGFDEYEQFNFVYDYMVFAQRCGLIKKKNLDILWKELREATNAS